MDDAISLRLTGARFTAAFLGAMLAGVALGLTRLIVPAGGAVALLIALAVGRRAHWFGLLTMTFGVASAVLTSWIGYSLVTDWERGERTDWASTFSLRYWVALIISWVLFWVCARRARATDREREMASGHSSP